MIPQVIRKCPVFILSTPRTGSTELVNQVAKRCNYYTRSFIEPDYAGVEAINQFVNYAIHNNTFIFKCHAVNVKHYNDSLMEWLKYDSAVCRISIRRRNIVDQIASYYVASHGRHKKWHYVHGETTSDTVDIDASIINHCIALIERCNQALDSLTLHYDHCWYYEDLLPFPDSYHTVTPKPSNYSDILNIIRHKLG